MFKFRVDNHHHEKDIINVLSVISPHSLLSISVITEHEHDLLMKTLWQLRYIFPCFTTPATLKQSPTPASLKVHLLLLW